MRVLKGLNIFIYFNELRVDKDDEIVRRQLVLIILLILTSQTKATLVFSFVKYFENLQADKDRQIL